jgi:multicomponent Na+:H+ antiporter subunit G
MAGGRVSGPVHVLVVVLLAAGVAVEILCCLGVLVMRSAYARLHYTAPAGLGALLVAIAILLREGFSLIGDKALLLAVFVLASSPVLSHVTARAARIRERGDGGLGEAEEEVG